MNLLEGKYVVYWITWNPEVFLTSTFAHKQHGNHAKKSTGNSHINPAWEKCKLQGSCHAILQWLQGGLTRALRTWFHVFVCSTMKYIPLHQINIANERLKFAYLVFFACSVWSRTAAILNNYSVVIFSRSRTEYSSETARSLKPKNLRTYLLGPWLCKDDCTIIVQNGGRSRSLNTQTTQGTQISIFYSCYLFDVRVPCSEWCQWKQKDSGRVGKV